VVAALMSSAAAGVAAPAIDGIISRGSLVGADVLNETGADQTIVKKVAVGRKTSAVWVAQNRLGSGEVFSREAVTRRASGSATSMFSALTSPLPSSPGYRSTTPRPAP
jgi:hypothetical protein